jgi:hypothetical protein
MQSTLFFAESIDGIEKSRSVVGHVTDVSPTAAVPTSVGRRTASVRATSFSMSLFT